MHFTCMVQDASKADFTVDTIVLADAAPAAVPEPAETEAAEVAAGAAETRPETAPKTADFAALTLLAGAAALVLTRRKALRK